MLAGQALGALLLEVEAELARSAPGLGSLVAPENVNLAAAVRNAGRVPITLKFRVGIDERYETFLDSGRIGEEEGCAAVGLHARTAAQLYHGHSDWNAIGELKGAVKIPVLGNGDIWEAEDALRMMRYTGCDGVIVGRGCLGRPWLFRDLADVFSGSGPQNPPNFGDILEIMFGHARMLADWFGERVITPRRRTVLLSLLGGLGLVLARAGHRVCPECGERMARLSPRPCGSSRPG